MQQDQPIKKRMASIKDDIVAVRKMNLQSKKNLLILDGEIKVLENRLQDPFSVVKDYFAVAKQALKANFQKESALHEEQVAFLQNQIHQMIEDKVKATQNCLILDQKIRHLTEDIG